MPVALLAPRRIAFLFAAGALFAPLCATAQAVDAKVLPLTAFAAPSGPLSKACAIGTESARAQRAILGLKVSDDPSAQENAPAQQPADAPSDMEGLASPDAQAASAAIPSPFPAETGSSLALASGACKALEEAVPDAANAPVVAEVAPYDFTEQNGEIQAVGAQGPVGSLRVSGGSSAFSFAFWKSSGKPASQSANSYIAGSRFIFFGRPGALYVFDRNSQLFCSNAVQQPLSAFDRTLREMPNGSVILSVWTPGAKDEGPKLTARILDGDALCPKQAAPE